MTESFTLQEAIADDMIALVNEADGIDRLWFAEFLEIAAQKQAERVKELSTCPAQGRLDLRFPEQKRSARLHTAIEALRLSAN